MEDFSFKRESLKMLILARHKFAISIGSDNCFSSIDEGDIWLNSSRDYRDEYRVPPRVEQLGKQVSPLYL